MIYVGAPPVKGVFRPYRRVSADFGHTTSEPVGGQGNAGERPEHHTGGRDGRTSSACRADPFLDEDIEFAAATEVAAAAGAGSR